MDIETGSLAINSYYFDGIAQLCKHLKRIQYNTRKQSKINLNIV